MMPILRCALVGCGLAGAWREANRISADSTAESLVQAAVEPPKTTRTFSMSRVEKHTAGIKGAKEGGSPGVVGKLVSHWESMHGSSNGLGPDARVSRMRKNGDLAPFGSSRKIVAEPDPAVQAVMTKLDDLEPASPVSDVRNMWERRTKLSQPPMSPETSPKFVNWKASTKPRPAAQPSPMAIPVTPVTPRKSVVAPVLPPKPVVTADPRAAAPSAPEPKKAPLQVRVYDEPGSDSEDAKQVETPKPVGEPRAAAKEPEKEVTEPAITSNVASKAGEREATLPPADSSHKKVGSELNLEHALEDSSHKKVGPELNLEHALEDNEEPKPVEATKPVSETRATAKEQKKEVTEPVITATAASKVGEREATLPAADSSHKKVESGFDLEHTLGEDSSELKITDTLPPKAPLLMRVYDEPGSDSEGDTVVHVSQLNPSKEPLTVRYYQESGSSSQDSAGHRELLSERFLKPRHSVSEAGDVRPAPRGRIQSLTSMYTRSPRSSSFQDSEAANQPAAQDKRPERRARSGSLSAVPMQPRVATRRRSVWEQLLPPFTPKEPEQVQEPVNEARAASRLGERDDTLPPQEERQQMQKPHAEEQAGDVRPAPRGRLHSLTSMYSRSMRSSHSSHSQDSEAANPPAAQDVRPERRPRSGSLSALPVQPRVTPRRSSVWEQLLPPSAPKEPEQVQEPLFEAQVASRLGERDDTLPPQEPPVHVQKPVTEEQESSKSTNLFFDEESDQEPEQVQEPKREEERRPLQEPKQEERPKADARGKTWSRYLADTDTETLLKDLQARKLAARRAAMDKLRQENLKKREVLMPQVPPFRFPLMEAMEDGGEQKPVNVMKDGGEQKPVKAAAVADDKKPVKVTGNKFMPQAKRAIPGTDSETVGTTPRDVASMAEDTQCCCYKLDTPLSGYPNVCMEEWNCPQGGEGVGIFAGKAKGDGEIAQCGTNFATCEKLENVFTTAARYFATEWSAEDRLRGEIEAEARRVEMLRIEATVTGNLADWKRLVGEREQAENVLRTLKRSLGDELRLAAENRRRRLFFLRVVVNMFVASKGCPWTELDQQREFKHEARREFKGLLKHMRPLFGKTMWKALVDQEQIWFPDEIVQLVNGTLEEAAETEENMKRRPWYAHDAEAVVRTYFPKRTRISGDEFGYFVARAKVKADLARMRKGLTPQFNHVEGHRWHTQRQLETVQEEDEEE